MADAHYYVSIADALFASEMYLDLGNYLAKCEKGELAIMDADPSKNVYAHNGARALIVEFPPTEFLKLAKNLKPYPNLCRDMTSGFSEGLDVMIDTKRATRDFPETLVRFAHGLAKYPELRAVFQERLEEHGLQVVTGKVDSGWGDAKLTASFIDKAAGNITEFKPHSAGPYISDRVKAPDATSVPGVAIV